MDGPTVTQVTALLLIACLPVFSVGGVLFTGRIFWKWPIGQTPAYLYWERGFVLAALLLNVLGMALLQGLLHEAGATGITWLAMVAYLLGAATLAIAEVTFLRTQQWLYPWVVFYVVTAFLAQALFGVAILQTGLVAAWVGWATLVWNLGWLIALSVFSRKDMYYPVLHHVAPLLIGIALLAAGGR
jgi:hypothetical protein